METTDALEELNARLDRMEISAQFNDHWSNASGLRYNVAFSLMILGLGLFLPSINAPLLSPIWLLGLIGFLGFIYGTFTSIAVYGTRRLFLSDPTLVEQFMRHFNSAEHDFQTEALEFLEANHPDTKGVETIKKFLSRMSFIEQHPLWVVFGYMIIVVGTAICVRLATNGVV